MSKILNYSVLMSIKIAFILANSTSPDEMAPYASFHRGSSLFAKVPVCRYAELGSTTRSEN